MTWVFTELFQTRLKKFFINCEMTNFRNSFKLWPNGHIICATVPAYRDRSFCQMIGEKEKKFKLTWKHYRVIASSAIKLWENRCNNPVFFTYTFPSVTEEKMAVRILSKHLTNLKKTYGLKSYIWVAELQKRGAIHFHCLFDMPFQPIAAIQDAWNCSIWSEVWKHWVELPKGAMSVRELADMFISNNSVRLPPNGAKVRDLNGLVNYLCKYMSKNVKEKVVFPCRCYAISHNVLAKPKKISQDDVESLVNMYENTVYSRDKYDLVILKQFVHEK